MKKGATLGLLMVLCSLFASISVMGVAEAEVNMIVVPDDYPSIAAAVGNATDGDTVYVKSGTYSENIAIGKPLRLLGENRIAAIINGTVNVNSWKVEVSGFTFWGTIKLNRGYYSNISDNIVTNSESGIRIASSYNNVSGNIIENIRGNAIYISHATGNVIQGNNIVSARSGVCIASLSLENTVCENTINNIGGNAIECDTGYSNTFVGNTIINSKCGVALSPMASDDNVFRNNNFVNNNEQVSAPETTHPSAGVVFSVCMWSNNYWSDYKGVDNDGDGIGDSPYIINSHNRDNSPLIQQHVIPEFQPELITIFVLVASLTIVLFKKKVWRQAT